MPSRECPDRSAARSRIVGPPCRRRPTSSKGSSTFSTAESVGTRLKNWNTKPTLRRRRRARSVSLNPSIRVPSSQTSPAVGRSSPASRLRSVDFPHPLGPMIATNSPRSIEMSTPRRPSTFAPPVSYVLARFPRLQYRCHQPSSFSASRCSISSSHSRSAFRCKIAPSTRSSAAGSLPVRFEQCVQVAQRLQVLAPLPLEQLLGLRQAS